MMMTRWDDDDESDGDEWTGKRMICVPIHET